MSNWNKSQEQVVKQLKRLIGDCPGLTVHAMLNTVPSKRPDSTQCIQMEFFNQVRDMTQAQLEEYTISTRHEMNTAHKLTPSFTKPIGIRKTVK